MIRKVIIRNIKIFNHLEFEMPDHLVIAGPNNSGKTTVLQAISARPTKDVNEDDLEKYIETSLIPVYIPPVSLLKREEYLLDSEAVRVLLVRGFEREILRNLLVTVSQDTLKWNKLREVVKSFFGYELLPPSATAEIRARYQHTKHDQSYDLSSAASGFLQVLMIYASLLYDKVSVILIDEPDAHLHTLLQQKIYRDLREYARQHGIQLIIATHSEEIIEKAAKEEALHILTGEGELRKISDRNKVKGMLRLIENTKITLALTEPGILYVEGETDIDILREWARILGHPLLSFLERAFCRETAEEGGKNGFPLNHFSSMRLVVPDFRGVELRDGDQGARAGSLPDGMKSLCWQRYEIENYLIHPDAIICFVEKNKGTNVAHEVDDYMKKQLPQAVYEDPFGTIAFLQDTKGKKLLSNLMQEAGINIKESDYHQIAAEMKEKEIHPEVVEKLDAIARHFGMMGGGA